MVAHLFFLFAFMHAVACCGIFHVSSNDGAYLREKFEKVRDIIYFNEQEPETYYTAADTRGWREKASNSFVASLLLLILSYHNTLSAQVGSKSVDAALFRTCSLDVLSLSVPYLFLSSGTSYRYTFECSLTGKLREHMSALNVSYDEGKASRATRSDTYRYIHNGAAAMEALEMQEISDVLAPNGLVVSEFRGLNSPISTTISAYRHFESIQAKPNATEKRRHGDKSFLVPIVFTTERVFMVHSDMHEIILLTLKSKRFQHWFSRSVSNSQINGWPFVEFTTESVGPMDRRERLLSELEGLASLRLTTAVTSDARRHRDSGARARHDPYPAYLPCDAEFFSSAEKKRNFTEFIFDRLDWSEVSKVEEKSGQNIDSPGVGGHHPSSKARILRVNLEGCDFDRLSRMAVLSGLRDRRILFLGDSLTRYQYLNLVHYLRTGRWSASHPFSECEKQWAGWNEFFEGTNSRLLGYEICDCERIEGKLIGRENRYYYDPLANISVSYIGFHGPYNPVERFALRDVFLEKCDRFLSNNSSGIEHFGPGCPAYHCSLFKLTTDQTGEDTLDRYSRETNASCFRTRNMGGSESVDDLLFVEELPIDGHGLYNSIDAVNPDTVIINSGLWNEFSVQRCKQLLELTEIFQRRGIRFIWKSTTKTTLPKQVGDEHPRKILRGRGWEIFDAYRITDRLSEVVSELREGSVVSMWDARHFYPWVYRGLNEVLITQLIARY